MTAIDRLFERRLAALINARVPGSLAGGLRGLEKETLRVTRNGRLSRAPHPRELGSALCHPHITTDYSESLLEMVTPTFVDNRALLKYLSCLQQFVASRLDDETLWCASMPCELDGESDVPIAHYGSSHEGRFKEIYRRGLLNRYGGMMQAIAGVHFNYSLPEQFWPLWAEVLQQRRADQTFVSSSYFDALRNFRRHGWLVSWLFGASPALCRSFVGSNAAGLHRHGSESLYGEYATSLRMSDIGYRNRNQAAVQVSVNSLDEYLSDLLHAVHTPHPAYERIGVLVDGDYRQLSPNVLQIENEYYSSIRPKRVPRAGELTAQALRRGGVQYVEMRALDLDPFAAESVTATQLDFLEAFMVLLLMKESPLLGNSEQEALDHNFLQVTREGRLPGLTLVRNGSHVPIRDWVQQLLDELAGVVELLDTAGGGTRYAAALQEQRDKWSQPALLPAARLLREMLEQREEFSTQMQRHSSAHRTTMIAHQADATVSSPFVEQATESLLAQQRLERSQQGNFAEYLHRRLTP
jgi:glutamate--cysteine ligase